jgi:hypothetical protein
MWRKQDDDMREFWLWYERSSHNVLHGHAVPPPLLERGPSREKPRQVSSRMERIFLAIRVALAVKLVGLVVWMLFFA